MIPRARFLGDDLHLKTLRDWAPSYRHTVWTRALADHGVHDYHLAAHLADSFAEERHARYHVLPDVVAVLSALRGCYALALVTNGTPELQEIKLRRANLLPYFNVDRAWGTPVKYLIWDFDGTLGYRSGMWSGTLVEVLRREIPECPATVDDMRPYMQAGFPWHDPEQPHTPHKTAEVWWEALLPVFERAFRDGARLGTNEARRLAQHVRAMYVNPSRWQLFDDTLPCLRVLRAHGWQHVVLSNHVPELPALIEALGLAPYIMPRAL